MAEGSITVVRNKDLFVSEPDPMWFGNERNPSRAEEQGWSAENWLRSRFHFSFAEYMAGPSSFGVLRVMNDDLVQPHRGFGTHPHRDMEILTFVVDGHLTHQDSLNSKETLGRGSVQFMTSGTGVRHSEHNLRNKPLRFIQSWVVPRQRGLKPYYGSMVGDKVAAEARHNKWAHLASDVKESYPTPVKINQDCNVFVAELASQHTSPVLSIEGERQAYMLCIEGDITVGGTKLSAHDAAEVKGPLPLELEAGPDGALVLLFEMELTEDSRSNHRLPSWWR